jgi:lipopolysaccharide/colanic/teichoic acid biosynthesis glycosyltransferase
LKPYTAIESQAQRDRRIAFERAIELPVSFLLLLFLTPMMLIIAGLVMIDGGPALYRQERIGRGGRRFTCMKFRSMVVDADTRLQQFLDRDSRARAEWGRDHKLRYDPRITRFGQFLRRSSLDELPQLINVLRGDMSLVGPRPIVEAEIGRYGRRYASYCSVRPGITGLWQVSGRTDISYRRRVAMDVLYVRRRSLCLYVWLILATVPAVLARRGAH